MLYKNNVLPRVNGLTFGATQGGLSGSGGSLLVTLFYLRPTPSAHLGAWTLLLS